MIACVGQCTTLVTDISIVKKIPEVKEIVICFTAATTSRGRPMAVKTSQMKLK